MDLFGFSAEAQWGAGAGGWQRAPRPNDMATVPRDVS